MWKSIGVWLLKAVIEHVVKEMAEKQNRPKT